MSIAENTRYAHSVVSFLTHIYSARSTANTTMLSYSDATHSGAPTCEQRIPERTSDYVLARFTSSILSPCIAPSFFSYPRYLFFSKTPAQDDVLKHIPTISTRDSRGWPSLFRDFFPLCVRYYLSTRSSNSSSGSLITMYEDTCGYIKGSQTVKNINVGIALDFSHISVACL